MWGTWKWYSPFLDNKLISLSPHTLIPSRNPKSTGPLQTTPTKCPTFLGTKIYLSKWCQNTYMYHRLLWHRPAMREKKTLWESHKAGHSLHRCSVPGDFRTPGGKQWLSQWAQEKTSRTPVQRAPSLHGWSPKPICMEKHKRLYHKGKRSPEDNPRSHTVCNWHCHFWIPVQIKYQVA